MPRGLKGTTRFTKYLQVSTPDEIHYGYTIAHQYESGNVNGWLEQLAEDAFNLLKDEVKTNGQKYFVDFKLPVGSGGKAMLYQFCRKALGSDTKNYPQQIGDCVSFGAKNATEYLICCQRVLGVAPDEFHYVFPPYYYGTSRVFIGGQHDMQDGSTGAWMAAAVQKYGALAADEPNVPAYAGSVAKQWGYKGPDKPFVDLASKHLIKSAAKMNSFQDVLAAVTNGYPCTVASNQGFDMQAGSDGFHAPKGSWPHQMSIIGADGNYKTPYVLILNSWGDVHGHLKDFDTGEDLPVGVLRVKADVLESLMISAGETFAYSHMDWFEAQKLPVDLFKLL